MNPVLIETTVQGFRVAVDRKGLIKNTAYSIRDYTKRLENWKWDKTERRYLLTNEFFHFDRDQEICYFPRYDLEAFLNYLTVRSLQYEVRPLDAVLGKSVSFAMLPHVTYKNSKQEGAVNFMTNPEVGPIRGLGLQTGVGKTVALIMALQKMGRRSFVNMTSRLEQWVKEMGAYTTLDENDIFIIQGSGSLTQLFTQIDKQLKPKIIMASTRTMSRYVDYVDSYKHLPHPSKMCEMLDIGVVATDEYHESFHANLMMHMMLNASVFIPITATFVANDPFVKDIFNAVVPKDLQFVGGDYDRYVNITSYRYTSGGYLIKPFHYIRRGGYSQVKFEEFLLSKKGRLVLDPMIETAFVPIIKEHYINIAEPGEKFLMLCATKELGNHLAEVLKRRFPGKTVSVFYSGMPTTILERFDIIISTPGSAGTGRDIKGLRTCFVFDSTQSESRNLQYLGRLRGPPQMLNEPHFVYLFLAAIPKHVEYNNTRSTLYGPRAKKFTHRSLS